MDIETLFKHFIAPLFPYIPRRAHPAARYEYSRRPEWLVDYLQERAVARRGRQADFRYKQAFGSKSS